METPRKTLEILCQEIQLHLNYCREWGISEQEILPPKRVPLALLILAICLIAA